MTDHQPLNLFQATMIAEGCYDLAGYDDDIEPEVVVDAWQMLIDTGACWTLQGFFGRTAQRMIEEGYCHAKGDN